MHREVLDDRILSMSFGCDSIGKEECCSVTVASYQGERPQHISKKVAAVLERELELKSAGQTARR